MLDQSEETLRWAANVSQVALGANTKEGDLTAPQRHGMGFVRCGAEDMEDDGRYDAGDPAQREVREAASR